MMSDEPPPAFATLVQKIEPHARLVRTWPLKGGVSAQVTALEVRSPAGHTHTWLVRQHGARDLHRNPHLAADEFHLLQTLHSAGIAAPTPIYLDASGELFPTPVLVLAYIDGEPEFSPTHSDDFLSAVARQLIRIHQVAPTHFDLSFLPAHGKGFGPRPAPLDASLDEGQIRDALESLAPPPPNPPALLHGDYWPGNLLCKHGQLVAVIDWEDAAVGDPLADVANARLELLWAFGHDAMERFTALYRSNTVINFSALPYWDLCAALRPASKLSTWGLDHATETTMRARHHLFVTQALEKYT